MSETPPQQVPTATARARSDTEYVIGKASDLPEGGRLLVTVGGREIGIFKVDGRIHAFLNRCPHRGGQLCKGDILGFISSERPGDFKIDTANKVLSCPWHGWEYDIETGQSWYREPGEPKRQRRYQDARTVGVQIKSGDEVSEELAAGTATVEDDSAQLVDGVEHRLMGPYTAEVFPVEIEDEYIVLSLRPTSVLSGPRDGPAPGQLRRDGQK
jgi:3-phenylpropionate/trans-cinnamate dioxygenase ferredoxin subunit